MNYATFTDKLFWIGFALNLIIALVMLVLTYTHERRWRRSMVKKDGTFFIYLCSPFRGPDEARNVAFAKRITHELSLLGVVVFCPHIYFTLFLNDAHVADREAGLFLSRAMMTNYHEIWFILPPWRNQLSSGMIGDNAYAQKLKKRCVYAFAQVEYNEAVEQLKKDLAVRKNKPAVRAVG